MVRRTRRRRRVIGGVAVASLAMVAGGTSAAVAAAHPSGTAGSALRGATRLVHGYEGYCALVHGGRVKCWGDNSYGELGAGITVASSNIPVAVKEISGATSLVSGYEGYCALVPGGRVECWGDNAYGELGAGIMVASSNVPVAVKGLSGATSLVSGYEGYCALVHGGRVECWGDNSYGELGANSAAASSNVAVPVR